MQSLPACERIDLAPALPRCEGAVS